MQKNKWQKIDAARKLLELGEDVSINDIRKAYRNKAKESHPDTCPENSDADSEMHRLNEAYRILMEHCETRILSLRQEDNTPGDDEDWWMDRFGQDPLWGRKRDTE